MDPCPKCGYVYIPARPQWWCTVCGSWVPYDTSHSCCLTYRPELFNRVSASYPMENPDEVPAA